MGDTAILNGFLQSDLDAAGFRIVNLDTSNLIFAGQPQDFPAQPNKFLTSYTAATGLFAARRPVIGDVSDFPGQLGQGGKFLSTNGTALLWATPLGGGGGGTNDSVLNVKQSPYNAFGDGVHDDRAAILAAINDSIAAGGLTVYFPSGVYLLSAGLAPNGRAVLLGDTPWTSILRLAQGVHGAIILLGAAGTLTRLGFDGNMSAGAQGMPTDVDGIACYQGNAINIFQCVVANCSSFGIVAQNCYGLTIRDTYVVGCGGYGIDVYQSARSLIFGNTVLNCALQGIGVINSPHCAVVNNQVYSCAPFGYGIFLSDSDNTIVAGNTVQQCAAGIGLAISYTRAISLATNSSYGYVVTGNNVLRNYWGGIIAALSHGFQITGNVITDNGQGGTDNATYTIEPGIVIDEANKGTGYATGDVLTVVGGTGTAAKCLVTTVSGGAITSNGLVVLSMGNYSVLPTTNPCSTTCTRSGPTGAKVIFTTTRIQNGGTGYVVGQILRATSGTFYNPVRLQVTSIGTGGVVTGYNILDGGGYTGTLPNPILFASDALGAPDTPPNSGSGAISPSVPEVSGGLALTPLWGLRYSQTGKFSPNLSFGIRTLGAGYFGVIGSNVIDATKTGTGILVSDASSGDYHTRSDYLTVVGNSLVNNAFAFKGATDATLDGTYIFHSLFANNLTYP